MNFAFNMLRPVEGKMKLFGFCARSLRTAWRDLELLRRLCFVNTHLNLQTSKSVTFIEALKPARDQLIRCID